MNKSERLSMIGWGHLNCPIGKPIRRDFATGVSTFRLEGVDPSEYPELESAKVVEATWERGVFLTDAELEDLNTNFASVVQQWASEACTSGE